MLRHIYKHGYNVMRILIIMACSSLLRMLIIRGRKVWIFGAWGGKSYSDNSKYLFRYVRSFGREILPIWFAKDGTVIQEVRKDGGWVCHADSRWAGLWWHLAEACFYSDTTEDFSWRDAGDKHKVQLWHGMPLKRIGYDINNTWGVIPSPDAMIATCELFRSILAQAFGVEESTVLNTGQPRNDVFFDPLVKRRVQTRLSVDRCFIISYLPTFRDHELKDIKGATPKLELRTVIEELIVHKPLQELLSRSNAIFVIKPHFDVAQHMAGSLSRAERIIVLPGRSSLDVQELLAASDILITDYSSCFFDFLLTERPVVCFPYDLERYVSVDRPLYFDYASVAPGKIVLTVPELVSALTAYFDNPALDGERRRLLRDKFHTNVDDRSSQRVFDIIRTALGK